MNACCKATWKRKDHRALEAATIVIENGCQVALMAPTEFLPCNITLPREKYLRARLSR